MANIIEIIVKGNDKASNEFQRASKSADGFRDSLKGIGQAAAGFLAAQLFTTGLQRAIEFFQSSTHAASDLGEALSKSNTVFGTQASVIESFAQSAAQNLGLSQRAALDAAGGFGNMFDQLGVGVQESSAMSRSMITLASDFASFHNADISEVLEAQSAAFRGEYDALQRFLPLINAASVEEKALEMTGKSATSALTAQDKALAVYQLMMDGAGEAVGDFARTSEGLANQERITAAELENVSAAIGEKLLPIQLKLNQAKLALATAVAERVIPALETLASTARDVLGPVMQTLSEHSDLVMGALAGIGVVLLATVVPGLVASAAAAVVAAAPFVALAAAGAAIGAALVWAYNNIEPFHNAVDKLAGFLASTAVDAWNGFVAVIQDLPERLAELKDRLTEFKDNLVEAWDNIATSTEDLRGRLSDAWTSIKEDVLTIVQGIVEGAQQFWADHGEQIIETIINLKDGIVEAWNTIKDAVLEIVGIIVDQIRQFWADNGEQITEDLSNLKDKFVEAWNAIYEAVAPVVEQIISIISAAVQTIVELWQQHGDEITAIISALWEAVKGIFSAALEFLLSSVSATWDLIVGVISGAISIITGIIQVFSGLLTGDWSMLWEGIQNIVSGAWEIITSIIKAAWALIVDIIKLGIALLIEILNLGWEVIKAAVSLAWELILTIISNAWDSIVSLVTAALSLLSSIITAGWNAIKSATSAAWDAIKSLVSAAWDALKSGAQSSISAIKSTISSGLDAIKSLFSSAWDAIKSTVSSAWDSIKSTVSSAASSIKSSLSGLWDNITSGLSSKVNSAIGLINNLIDAYNSIPVLPNVSTLSYVGSSSSSRSFYGSGTKRASGGITSGMTLLAEAGRELMSLPGGGTMMALPNGTMVHSNADTEQMLASGSAAGLTVNVYAQGSILVERDIRSIVLDTVRTVGLDSYGLRGTAR